VSEPGRPRFLCGIQFADDGTDMRQAVAYVVEQVATALRVGAPLLNRLIQQRPQFCEVVHVSRGNHLGEVDDNQVLDRIDPVGGVIGAAPAELAPSPGCPSGMPLDRFIAERIFEPPLATSTIAPRMSAL